MSQSQSSNEPQVPTPKKTNGLAIASLVSSFFFGMLGIILGIIALTQVNKSNDNGKGLAVAGICIGVFSMVMHMAMWDSMCGPWNFGFMPHRWQGNWGWCGY